MITKPPQQFNVRKKICRVIYSAIGIKRQIQAFPIKKVQMKISNNDNNKQRQRENGHENVFIYHCQNIIRTIRSESLN